MAMPDAPPESDPQLRERLRELEWENRRLRDAVGDQGLTPEVAAWFDPAAFKRVHGRLHIISGLAGLPIWFGMMVLFFLTPGLVPQASIGPMPLLDLGGMNTGWYGLGFGIIAVGGVSVGVVAIGGGAFGVIAYGGGAVGGGAAGFIAIGGAAFGYVAMGGSCYGYYAMGLRAHGKHVLALNRQDEEAAAFFRRYIPGLGAAVSKPLPVSLGPATASDVPAE